MLLTPEEAAEVLSIGRTTVYELMSSGALRSVSIGRSRRVPARALEEFVGLLDSVADHRTQPGGVGLLGRVDDRFEVR